LTLELYILRRLAIGLCFAAGGMGFIAGPGILINAVHKLASVGMSAVLGYIPLVMLDLVPYLIPMGFLLALVATYGRLSADNEWTAIRMAGIHPLRIVRPALLIALVLSGALYWLASEVAPHSDFKMREYRKSSVMRMLRTLNPGRTELKFNDFYLSARERDPDNRFSFQHVFMHLPSDGKNPSQSLFAQNAEFSFEGATMFVDLTWPRWIGQTQDASVGHLTIQCDLDRLFKTDVVSRTHWRYQTSGALRERIARTESAITAEGEAAIEAKAKAENLVPPKELSLAVYELHSREALAAVCPMFLLLGIPTGLLMRRGSQLGALAAAVGYALLYYLLSMRLGKGLALATDVPMWLAAWGTTILGCLVGLALSWFALRR
jgi:lipopolysaccharide export LptBFGC system permease protein LptF